MTIIRIPHATGHTHEAREALRRVADMRGPVLILDGDREEMRMLVRTTPGLERFFRNFLDFPDYGPIELMKLLVQACDRDKIELSREARFCSLIMFHVYSDRKDRRFNSSEGVELLYDRARQKFLERCSRTNKFDLRMERDDLDLPNDPVFRRAIEHNPAMVSFCPSCNEENPWVLGLEKSTICLHCETAYQADWGLWKESIAYRRLYDSRRYGSGRGAITRRSHSNSR